MLTLNEDLNSQALDAEMQWLSTVIDYRLTHYFEPGADAPLPVPPIPVTGSTLAEKPCFYILGLAERIILALALAPHLSPKTLDPLLIRDKNLEREFTLFGGVRGLSSGGFAPTGDTAAFLVGGTSPSQRLALLQFFGPNHHFHKSDILRLERSSATEPALSGRLLISEEWLHLLCTGVSEKPCFSSDFPAKRETTSIDWEDLILSERTQDQLHQLVSWMNHRFEWSRAEPQLKRPNQGLLASMYGPTGVGKTVSALLIGKQAGADVYKIDLKLIGAWDPMKVQQGLDAVFRKASNRNWIFLIENAELLSDSTVSAVQASNFACMRMHLKNFHGLALLESNTPLTASVETVDLAIVFDVPELAERIRLWNVYLPKEKADASFSAEEFAERYPISGAQIANIVFQASLKRLQRGELRTSTNDLQKCLNAQH